jgi:Bacterial PH domain
MSENTVWFRSKVDWWLGLLLVVAPAVTLVGGLSAPESQRLAALTGTFVLAAVYLGLVFPMRYGITDSELVVRHGLVRQRVKLADITAVIPTRNPISSPALSLDRLRITFGTGFGKNFMISPVDKQQFLVELALRARLVRDGDGLKRL